MKKLKNYDDESKNDNKQIGVENKIIENTNNLNKIKSNDLTTNQNSVDEKLTNSLIKKTDSKKKPELKEKDKINDNKSKCKDIFCDIFKC